MSEGWDLQSLRQHIQRMPQDNEARCHCSNALSSIGALLCRVTPLHFAAVRNALQEGFGEQLFREINTAEELMEAEDAVFDPSETQMQNLEKIEAHLLALMHGMRSTVDMLGVLISFLILPKAEPLHQCYFGTVASKLPESSPVRNAAMSLKNSDEFTYLNAFISVAKHRHLITVGPMVNHPERRYGIGIERFQYRRKEYPRAWADQLLTDMEEVRRLIIGVGREINATVLAT